MADMYPTSMLPDGINKQLLGDQVIQRQLVRRPPIVMDLVMEVLIAQRHQHLRSQFLAHQEPLVA